MLSTPPPNPTRRDRPTVVIVGAGFAGVEAAKRLRRSDADVVILDRSNHHLFQPLLYQVATAVLTPADIAFPIRRIFRHQKNVTVFRSEVRTIDRERSVVRHADGTETPFDYLVLAAGAGQSYFGHAEWEANAPGMKTLEDAARIRGRILQAFEDAEAENDLDALRAHLTFVIVGAGPTGVELSGAIKELAVDSMDPDMRRVDAERARVVLVEGLDRVLPAMSEASSANAEQALRRLGVEVRTKTRVTEVDSHGVTIQVDGRLERIESHTVLWAAGVEASPLARSLGAPLDRAGRVLVGPDLSVVAADGAESKGTNMFVAGDLANVTCPGQEGPVPGVCPAAIQMGRFVGDLIAETIRTGRRPTRSFVYWDKGSLATIGRARAVADIFGGHYRGLVAWLLWCFVHVLFLIGFRNRLFVMLSWAASYILFSKGARLILGDPQSRVVKRAGSHGPRQEPMRADESR
ncbi:MAG: NAD(P)/FAD-dependent oxidoreductase [Phycisphaerae bacterium]|jgi:NADH dehydrogenase|nr:NAD(P)/FAD-dependent oxidoreductase [Phycisphaerae bacterium]